MKKRTIEFVPGEKVPGTRWTVLKEVDAKNGERMYECRCNCGTVKNVSAKNLKYGKSLSCGCLQREKARNSHYIDAKNDLDLSGRIFGKVKVLEKKSGYGTMSIWKCECLGCGKIFEVVQSSLTSGRTESCGCVHYKHQSEKCKDYLGITDGTNASRIASRKVGSANTTSVRGVSFNKALGKYVAYIGFKGKLYNLGYYNNLSEAKSARKMAEKEKYGNFLDWYYKNYQETKKLKYKEDLFISFASNHTDRHSTNFIKRVEEIYRKNQAGEDIVAGSRDYSFISMQKYRYKEMPAWRRQLLDRTGILDLIGNRNSYSFEYKLERAKKYYAEFGNLRVPSKYVDEDGFALGRWIINLRNIYNGNTDGFLNEERIKKLESIGIEWSINAKLTWEEWYDLAKEYYAEHGNLKIPTDCKINGCKIGVWIANQRTARNNPNSKHKITQEQIERLDKIGMVWNSSYDEHFSNRVEKIYKKIRAKEEIEVRSSDYLFIVQQKHNYSNLPKWRQDLLRQTGVLKVIENRNAQSFDYKFGRAKKYYEKFGHLRVPPKYVDEDGFALGRWISNLRAIYSGNIKGLLNEQRIKKLESIGIEWKIKDKLTWEQWYALAEEYYNIHGNLKIPNNFEVNGHKVGQWLVNQRHAKNNPKSGRRITQEQIERLDKIGMVWNVRKQEREKEDERTN